MKTPTGPLIRFKRASLGYGGAAVVEGVNLEIRPGSFWGVLGHNGSGKTTVLKTMLGLIPCLRGKVARGDVRFGYVPQKEKLDTIYPMSAFDVAVMGTYRRIQPGLLPGRSASQGLTRRCLRECGAANFAGKPYSALSGGQKQRVLIARALAAEPNLLALDEPLAGIDITTQHALLELLKTLKETHGLTILMISHRVRAEKGLFTDIAWVDEGRVETGPAEEMLSSGRLSEVFRSEL